MSTLLKKIFVVSIFSMLLIGCAKDMTTEGRFNVVPWSETTTTTTMPTTTTTTMPTYYEHRWEPRPLEKPTPFEIDKPIRPPKGCEEGEERGVDC